MLIDAKKSWVCMGHCCGSMCALLSYLSYHISPISVLSYLDILLQATSQIDRRAGMQL